MEINNFFFIIFIGKCIISVVMSYDPLLTYTVRFKKMTAQPNLTSIYTVNQYRETQLVNAFITIDTTEPINKVIVDFERCDADRINCEYFQSWEVLDTCKKLREKNQLWSRWYDSVHPPLVCPINKKNYQLVNGTIDIRPILVLYPIATDYEWRVTQKFYAGDTFVGGYMMEISFFGYRKRKSNKNKQ